MSANMPAPEPFCINDVAIGKVVRIREAPDAMLERHLGIAQKQHAQSLAQAQAMLQQTMTLAEVCSAIAFEIDRRKHTITIAREIPKDLRR